MKETIEVIDAAGDIGAVFIKHLKDGFQPGTDLTAIALDVAGKPELRAALQKAADNIQAVPAELKAIDVKSGFDLAEVGLRNARKTIAALE